MIPKYSRELLALCASVRAKRPRAVIDHILKHGQVTTDDLKNLYGYNHPPRAVRDVRETGIPLETFRVTGSDGRKIAAYRFGDPGKTMLRRMDGRTGLSKKIRDELVAAHGSRCFIYLETMDKAELQIDHRIPYEISGDTGKFHTEDFMLLCASANRAKSWSCEHCENWRHTKSSDICRTCYWSFPECYQHVAMRQIRRFDLIWQGVETERYDSLSKKADEQKESLPDFVKKILARTL
ncbi:MAG: helix-turn-helix domain-containing protein [Betaproteobacteria bacterium]|nr:helix-turn-helix domain-containing protein [Betaproteobacteria bacterium]